MKARAPIPFAGSRLAEVRHVCAFFRSEDEQYRVLLPFIKDGFQCGHKAVHVVSPDQRSSHLQRLTAAGIDTTAAEQNGQLELRSNAEAYLREGRFDQDQIAAAKERHQERISEDDKGATVFRLAWLHHLWVRSP